MIELIPAIDLIEGKCVRLTKGDYQTKKVYAEDPVRLAEEFEQMGFTRLHVVDLDGARSHHVVNDKVLRGIAEKTKLAVDFGGGVKSNEDLERVFAAGAAMATVGSIAVTEPETLRRWMGTFGPERFILGADVREGRISINGWQKQSTQKLSDFLNNYLEAGIRNVLCTEISRDGMLQGPAIELYCEVMEAHPECHLIASGGVSGVEDIIELQQKGIPAVVIGKAIYEGHIDPATLIDTIKASSC